MFVELPILIKLVILIRALDDSVNDRDLQISKGLDIDNLACEGLGTPLEIILEELTASGLHRLQFF